MVDFAIKYFEKRVSECEAAVIEASMSGAPAEEVAANRAALSAVEQRLNEAICLRASVLADQARTEQAIKLIEDRTRNIVMAEEARARAEVARERADLAAAKRAMLEMERQSADSRTASCAPIVVKKRPIFNTDICMLVTRSRWKRSKHRHRHLGGNCDVRNIKNSVHRACCRSGSSEGRTAESFCSNPVRSLAI